jgi:hypothetical protein
MPPRRFAWLVLLLCGCQQAPSPEMLRESGFRWLSIGYVSQSAGDHWAAIHAFQEGGRLTDWEDRPMVTFFLARSLDAVGQHVRAAELYTWLIGPNSRLPDRLRGAAAEESERLNRLIGNDALLDARNAELFAIERYFTPEETSEILADLRPSWEGTWCSQSYPGSRTQEQMSVRYDSSGQAVSFSLTGMPRNYPTSFADYRVVSFRPAGAAEPIAVLALFAGEYGLRRQFWTVDAYPLVQGGPQPCRWNTYSRSFTCEVQPRPWRC